MNWYYYLSEQRYVIRVFAKKRPSVNTIPKNGCWIIQEYTSNGWENPCFAEVTWGTLKKQQYIGKIKSSSEPAEK